MEIICKTQNYVWGVNGMKSSVAQLIKSVQPDIEIYENLPYAELWMGTHPNGPSVIKESRMLLSSYIENYPQSLGSNIISKFGNNLCYLFKVLSVNQSLSIQVHPEKTHAEQLHKERPDLYKDPNHKPEMAIALTTFEALCGFRSPEEIQKFFQELTELRRLVGEDNAAAFLHDPSEENLKKCYASLMTACEDVVSKALQDVSEKFAALDENSDDDLLRDLFLTLLKQYPGDVGCFSIYILNYIILQPGEAIFLGPNIIHAYLLGDCIECMACSDNVVRAGLTPKFKDVDTLLSMLEYQMLPAEALKFTGSKINDNTTLYKPPVPDFSLQKIECDYNSQKIIVTEEASASIVIVIKGIGKEVVVSPPSAGGIKTVEFLKRGSVIYIEAGQTLSFCSDDQFLAFRALCV